MTDVLVPSERASAIEPTLIRSLRSGMGPSTIDFGLGQSDLAVTQAVRDDLVARLDVTARSPYTPNAGLFKARQAVAEYVGAKAEEVLLTCGVQQGLALAILGLCDRGDEVLVPDPGFPAYANLVRAAGARPVPYPLRAPSAATAGWGLDGEAIIERLSDETRLVVLNNPANPTGSVAQPHVLGQVLEALWERGIGWLSDEIYEDYIWNGTFVSARDAAPTPAGGIALSGLSKSHHLMGWRLGWMVAPAPTIEALTPLHQHMVTCAPRPSQEAIEPALTSHASAMAVTRQIFGDRRRRVLEAMQALTLNTPATAQGAFYLFVDVRPWLERFESTMALATALLDEEDVLVVPGEGFGRCGLGHLRVAYTIGGDRLDRGMERIASFLNRHRP